MATPRLLPDGTESTHEDRHWPYKGVRTNGDGTRYHVWRRLLPCPWTGKHTFIWQADKYRVLNVSPPPGWRLWEDGGRWWTECPAGDECGRCRYPHWTRADALLYIEGEASWFA